MDIHLALTEEETVQGLMAVTRELNYFHITGVAEKSEYRKTYDTLVSLNQKLRDAIMKERSVTHEPMKSEFPLTEDECLKL